MIKGSRTWFQKLQKQVSLFRSCTLCVQGSAQKQDVAEPLCRPPRASPLVYTAREKDPRQGLRCLRCWPVRAPCPGSLLLSGV